MSDPVREAIKNSKPRLGPLSENMKRQREKSLHWIASRRSAYVPAPTPLVIEVPPAAAIDRHPQSVYDPGTRDPHKR